MQIIAISGKLGVGKSTVAEMLRVELEGKGHTCTRVSFGDPIKKITSKLYNFPIDWCYVDKEQVIFVPNHIPLMPPIELKTNGGYTVRVLMQGVGEFMRKIDPSYWNNKMKETLCNIAMRRDTDFIIIDDVRFPTEILLLGDITEVSVGPVTIVRIMPYPEYNPLYHIAKNSSETALDSSGYNSLYDKIYTPQYGELQEVAMDICKRYVEDL
jgi:hypothetical protein